VGAWWSRPRAKRELAAVVALVFVAGFGYWIWGLNRFVEDRLKNGIFSNTWSVYATPPQLSINDKVSPDQVVAMLRQSSYSESADNPLGHFKRQRDQIEIYPGKDSYFNSEPARVRWQNNVVTDITALDRNERQNAVMLEPPLVANLSGKSREMRRLIPYNEIPKPMVNALLSAEDKRFFEHFGFDSLRLTKAILVNLKAGEKAQGGSTITMQLARSLWLSREKKVSRKITELALTVLLEAKLSKEQIFEHYANEVYLGRRDTFEVRGLGQAARAYFNKDLRQISLAQAATLAGIIQRPSYFDPLRSPDRVLERRNLVLSLMERNGYISAAEKQAAAALPLGIAPHFLDDGDAPYFLSLAEDELKQRISGDDLESDSFQVFTSLDLNLQRAAEAAIREGMERLDKRLKPLQKHDKQVQVALIALDPHTGEVRAAVGGRSYAQSQLNRLNAKRQPGSSFKPFVYAAALSAPKTKTLGRVTLSTVLRDEPTTFKYGDEVYTPSNFGQKYRGEVTVRTAITNSLNIPTVNLAQEIGFKYAVSVAKAAGLKVFGTPAAALGSYEATPVELAGAYTIFANEGEAVQPTFLSSVRTLSGRVVFEGSPERKQVLDPKVAWLMLQPMQDVINYGTGGGARWKGLYVPAAGKTGTSRDGWFAGFISGLLCIVWVGYDDNTELELEASKTAVPIWGDFMKRAVDLGYPGANFGNPPQGLTSAEIDPDTGMLAGADCPVRRTEFYLAGTSPSRVCDHLMMLMQTDFRPKPVEPANSALSIPR
jgi:penicillin-binding protein 1B